MFFAGDGDLTGQKAWKLLRSDCFERAFEADDPMSVRGTIPDRDVHYRATLFKLEDGDRCCGIFIDTTEEERVTFYAFLGFHLMLGGSGALVAPQGQRLHRPEGLPDGLLGHLMVYLPLAFTVGE